MSKKEELIYGDYTMDEILDMESKYYYVQMGPEMIESETGKLSFSKERAEDLFFQVWEGLKHMKKHGSEEEKAEAKQFLLNLRIHKLRIH